MGKRRTLYESSLNKILERQKRQEQKWWARNAETVCLLDAGEPVKAVALVVGKAERTVRQLRSELRDLRQSEGTF